MLEVESINGTSLEETHLLPSYRSDLREFTEKQFNKFVKLNTVNDWSQLTWKDVGKPYAVTSYAKEKLN
ncbi:hypothetical protein [Cytobacillus oceanisediminis]|uniref:Uncharacterized protein n=1 Tax=Cytobacillus oceanisediminis TaxID=665099 RepID=A0A562JTJ8_9BACI|nr:hypothetical protein [Cytobacillus oceanisediminis]TWH86507.1 hypothetical protein IQ19_02529 [Cytobacillus oceanisediminis]